MMRATQQNVLLIIVIIVPLRFGSPTELKTFSGQGSNQTEPTREVKPKTKANQTKWLE